MRTTWHARTSEGAMIIIRQVLEIGREPTYEIHRYSGDIRINPMEEPLPDSVPEELKSQEDAIEHVRRTWDIEHVFMPHYRTEAPMIVDFETVLKTSCLAPLHVGLGANEIINLVGLPDAVGQSAIGGVWWLYGSVQIDLYDQRLRSIEIDRGRDEFTVIQFSNWFLRDASLCDVKMDLSRRSIAFFLGRCCESKAILFPSDGSAVCLIDFDEEEVVHAFYWGELGVNVQLESTQLS